MKLLIAIPALNEEDSIESIIRRSLDAREKIVRSSPVTEVEITVVSDGSTDRTVELASRYTDRINLIVFEKNRGYGAAIKEAWDRSDADLLSFLDADGTCDPLFFTDLCNTLHREDADVVLGSRLNPESKMPLIRRVGNVIFAVLVTLLSSSNVRDTASGMRVVRRSSLPRLYPLPDGLHFTPAMSARALIGGDLKIVEIPMPYKEREGQSKLRVIKDGLRFLKIILETAFLYRPSRPLGIIGILFLLIACGLMAYPTAYYAQNHTVQEWMIYRFIVSNLLATSGLLLLCASYLSKKIVHMTLSIQPPKNWTPNSMESFFQSRGFWAAPLALFGAGGALAQPSLVELARTGATYEHWSRFIVMSFLVQTGLILGVTKGFDYVLTLISGRLNFLKSRDRAEAGREEAARV